MSNWNPNNPYGGPPQQGGFPPVGQQPQQGGFPPVGQQPQQGGFPPVGQQPQQGGFPPVGQQPQQGGYPPFGQQPQQGGFPPAGQQPQQGGYPPFGQQPQQGGYPPFGQQPQQGGFPPAGQQPQQGGFPPVGQQPQQGFSTGLAAGVIGARAIRRFVLPIIGIVVVLVISLGVRFITPLFGWINSVAATRAVYLDNPGLAPATVTINGASVATIAPGGTYRYDVQAGTYTVVTTINGQPFQDTFTVPETPGDFRAVYDLAGTGIYVEVTVGYGSVNTGNVRRVGEGQRFIVYSASSGLDFNARFPETVSTQASGTIMTNLCRADPSSEHVPCAD